MDDVTEDEPTRLPGLYRGWDLCQILVPGAKWRIEEAGATREGAVLYAVYRSRADASDSGASS